MTRPCSRDSLKFGGAPPGLVGAVPEDRLRQTRGEIGVDRLPAELLPELGRVDDVAAAEAAAVTYPVEVILTAAERAQNLANDRQVAALAVDTNQASLAHATARKDRAHRRAAVLDVDPVADVEPVAVEHGAPPIDQARHLARDELLHAPVGAVVVRADGYGGLSPYLRA